MQLSPDAEALKIKLDAFVKEYCQPAELEYERHMENLHGADRWMMDAVPPCMEKIKLEAKRQGLWNLFLPHKLPASFSPSLSPPCNLSYREYGILCETMGSSFLAPEACNCSAPDTGNMEVLLQFGTPAQQHTFLVPLLEGTIRSAFLMTEPHVASSDATNIETKLTKVVDKHTNAVSYILDGKKWWSTGVMDPRCKVAIVLARMDYSLCPPEHRIDTETERRHRGHTMVVVSTATPGFRLVRPLTVFGYDDAPHGHAEVHLDNVALGSDSVLLGEGRGFEIAQARLGPGRIHHCMRAVGQAQRCYDAMIRRVFTRRTFGKELYRHGGCQNEIADSITDLTAARLLTLSCAAAMDECGNVAARNQIAMIKVAVPELTYRVVDRAVQIFGGAGVCGDHVLARTLAGLRTLRLADGPDAVHRRTLALMEVKKAAKEQKRLRSRI